MPGDSRIIVVSGLPGAGKSTTAQLLAARMPPAAHVEADRLQELIVAGGVGPDASGIHGEAERQLRLRLRNACLLARSFAEHGFSAIIDDIVAGPRFDHLVEDLAGTAFGFVMLFPDFEHVKARWRAMGSPFVDSWDWIDDEIRTRTPRVGLWLDTTHLTPDQTVDEILNRLDETTVRRGMSMLPIVIRDARLPDMDALRAIFRRAALSNENDRAMLLEHPEFLVFSDAAVREGRTRVAAAGDELVGFHSTLVSDEVVEVEDLFVDPDWRRRGIATELIRDVRAVAQALGLTRVEVTANPHALEFYESAGFIVDREVAVEVGTAFRMHLEASGPASNDVT